MEKGAKSHVTFTFNHGDFNAKIDQILAKSAITENEATFCLLDQRTFECDWSTVQKIAQHKAAGHKIELFYFLANGWLERALSGQKDTDKLARWWGRDNWPALRTMSRDQRRDILVSRMKNDLGYRSVKPWPIYERLRCVTRSRLAFEMLVDSHRSPNAPQVQTFGTASGVQFVVRQRLPNQRRPSFSW